MNKEVSCLITGCPRSGTTFIGEILSIGISRMYLYEPTNFLSGDYAVKSYFPVPGTEQFTASTAIDLLKRVRRLDLNLKPGLWGDEEGVRLLLKKAIGGRSRVSLNISKLNPLVTDIIWKDPFAFFMVPAILAYSPMPVIVTRRGVEQVCASFKRLNWTFDCQRILVDLNDDSLPISICRGLDFNDPVQSGAVLWNIMEERSRLYTNNDNVIAVSLEDIIINPEDTCKKMFDHCGFQLTEATMMKILSKLPKDQGIETPSGKRAHQRGRSINGIRDFWKKSLSKDDLKSISDICNRFERV